MPQHGTPIETGAKPRSGGMITMSRRFLICSSRTARSEIPRLQALEKALAARGWKPKELDELRIDELIKHIESDDLGEPLIPLVNAS